ncbi:MAG TPA: hypothetical protein VJU61_09755, partial [Polyangiaceae bacterium]|nr:hypothetical protein [Polyangiaceae bacterium]
LRNAELENVDALGGLESVASLEFGGNPRLRHLPEFTQLLRLDRLGISDNDSLQNVPTLPKLLSDVIERGEYVGQPEATLIIYRPSSISILYNASLTSITLSAGWFSAGHVGIWNNDALTRVEFTQQRSMEQLVLINNASLESVELGVLGTVDRLVFFGSAQLDSTVFDSVRTFETLF